MALRGTPSNFIDALKLFDRQININFPYYKNIAEFADFESVALSFEKLIKFLSETFNIILYEGFPLTEAPKDYVSAEDAKENWNLLMQNQYAANHVKISCLREVKNYYDSPLLHNRFDIFCAKAYLTPANQAFKNDIFDYLILNYPQYTREEIGKIIADNYNSDL